MHRCPSNCRSYSYLVIFTITIISRSKHVFPEFCRQTQYRYVNACNLLLVLLFFLQNLKLIQPAFTCSKLTIETLEQRCEICSKLTIKLPKRRQWRRFDGFVINFERISHLCSSDSIANFEYVIAGCDVTSYFGLLQKLT